MRQEFDSKGFTLIELLLAMLLAIVAMTGVYATYLSQQDSYVAQEQIAGVQQNIRAGMQIMSREIRMAGFDSYSDVITGAGITAANANSISFTVSSGGGQDGDGADNDGDGEVDEVGELRTISFRLYDAFGDGDMDLGMEIGAGGNQPVAENIDALDFVYYGVNNNVLNHGGGGWTAGDPIGAIRTVEITMVARTDREDRNYTNKEIYTNKNGDVLLDLSAAGDHFRRRTLTVQVKCRNMGLE